MENLTMPESSRLAGPGSAAAHSGRRLPYRVAFCTNFLPPYRLAAMKQLSDAFQAFKIFVSTEMEEDRPWRPNWSGLPVVRQRSLSWRTSTQHPHGFRESRTLHIPYDTFFRLLRFRPEVVISMELGMRSVLAALYCAWARACRFVLWADLSEVTEEGRGALRTWLRRWLIRRASAVLVNGASGRRYIEALGGDRERIFEIPYTTDLDLFLRQPLFREPAVRKRLLYVGQLIPRKGLISFLAVCARWCELHSDRVLEILVVGDGETAGTLESLRLPGNLSIEWQHSIQYGDMPNVYRRGGVLILPTLADTWALVVNEAMAAGLPVLGSVYSQAVDEMVVDGVNGWQFRSDDPEDSYRALCQVLDCSDRELAAMGKRARETSASIRQDIVTTLVTDVVQKVRRGRGAILTNMLAPYRIPVYSEIGRAFDLTVITSRHEKNRTHWKTKTSPGPFSLRQSAGLLFTIPKKDNGKTFDYTNLQLPFGALFDLFRIRPDWMISFEMGFRSLIALFYSRLTGAPLWVWWGGTRVTERRIGPLKRALRQVFVRQVKNWISYGLSSTEYLKSIGVPASRILTIQNCAAKSIDPQRPPQISPNAGKPRFLCVGQLIGRKGIDALLRGLAVLQDEGLRCSLSLLGSGPEKTNLERLASQLGLEDVQFLGENRPEDVRSVYSSADCVLFPTMEDVWGLVVNEAILAGVPVLCSVYAGCADELVPPEYRFDPRNPESVNRALRIAFRGDVKPIPISVLRSPESVAQAIVAAIHGQLAKADAQVAEPVLTV